MKAIAFTVLLALSFTAMLAAAAQPAGKMPRIGVIMQGIPPGEAGDELDVFRQGLRDLGYVEGRRLPWRSAGARGNTSGTRLWPPTWPGCPWTSSSRRVARQPARPSTQPPRFRS